MVRYSHIRQKKTPDTITTATRNHTVICPHPGNKHDTFNTTLHTRKTTTHTASDKISKSEVTTESAGLAPIGARLKQSVSLTLDAARRKGSPQSYRAHGRILPQNSPRVQRPKATKNYYTAQKYYFTQKNNSGYPRPPMLRVPISCIDTTMYASTPS